MARMRRQPGGARGGVGLDDACLQERPAELHGYPFTLTVTIVPVRLAVAFLTLVGAWIRYCRNCLPCKEVK
jgi:hypothetical protein